MRDKMDREDHLGIAPLFHLSSSVSTIEMKLRSLPSFSSPSRRLIALLPKRISFSDSSTLACWLTQHDLVVSTLQMILLLAKGRGWLLRHYEDKIIAGSTPGRISSPWDSFFTTPPIIVWCSPNSNFLFYLRYIWDILPYLALRRSCRDLLARLSILQLYKGRSPSQKRYTQCSIHSIEWC